VQNTFSPVCGIRKTIFVPGQGDGNGVPEGTHRTRKIRTSRPILFSAQPKNFESATWLFCFDLPV
jgi:hypothetical protein